MTKPITMSFFDRRYILNEFPSASEVVLQGRYLWLKKACWKFLKKTGCVIPHFDSHQTVTQVRIDPDKLVTGIIREAIDQFNRLGDSATKVLLGHADMSRLLNDPKLLQYFDRPFNFHVDTRRFHQTVFGLEIHVIPHMEGVLVLGDNV
jgi:hypothetical protein